MQGADALMKRMKAIGEGRPVLRVAQVSTVREAKILVHVKSGFLRRNIVPGQLTDTHAQVEARTRYAAPVELGSKPHIIRPKKPGGVLAWGGMRRLSGTLKSGSSPTHFARLVHHPGTKPYPYLIPGAQKAIADMKDVIVQLWNRAA